MKIIYLITKSEIGGAQTHVLSLLKYMKEKGNDVALMSYPNGWLEAEAKNIGVKFYSNKYFSNSFNPFKLFSAVKEVDNAVLDFNPGIVHCHSSGAGFIGRIEIRNKIPTIFTAHSWAFTKGSPFLRKVIAIIAEKIVSKYTNKIICVSEFDTSLALKYKIAPSDKLKTIYNGVPELKVKENKIESETINFLSVGRFAYPKRFDLLVESIAKLPKDILNKVKLSIVGFGPLKDDILNLVNKFNLKENINILDKQTPEELNKTIYNSDVFILLSDHEGFPMTILEAMSAGLPIIASSVGGIPEEIDSSCGILVNNNKKEISEAIIKLVGDIELRKNMGEKSKDKIRNNFSFDKFLSETENLYKEILVIH